MAELRIPQSRLGPRRSIPTLPLRPRRELPQQATPEVTALNQLGNIITQSLERREKRKFLEDQQKQLISSEERKFKQQKELLKIQNSLREEAEISRSQRTSGIEKEKFGRSLQLEQERNKGKLSPRQLLQMADKARRDLEVLKQNNRIEFEGIKKQLNPGETSEELIAKEERAFEKEKSLIKLQSSLRLDAQEQAFRDRQDSEKLKASLRPKPDERPLTQAQSTAAKFAVRMIESEEIFSEFEALGFDMRFPQTAIGKSIPERFKRTGQKSIEQAQRTFIASVLREESGAVISESEFRDGKLQYFPVAGDKPFNIEQKKRLRKIVTDSFVSEARGRLPKGFPGGGDDLEQQFRDEGLIE